MATLSVHVNGFSHRFKIMTFNVDQALREEAHDETKWNVREPRIRALIEEVDADIVCLQEMRKLPDARSTVNEFLSSFKKYDFVIGYRNASSLSFGQAILFKRDRFYPMQTTKKWLSDTPDVVSDSWSASAGGSAGRGYLVLGVQFVTVENGAIVSNREAPFWVFNTHFGLEEDLKTKSCFKLLQILQSWTYGRQAFLVTGDFNFFPDRDGNSQRAILTERLVDAGKGAVTLLGRQIEGTFVGYEHDTFKADLENMVSRLDHIFFSDDRILSLESPRLYTKTMLPEEPKELTTRDYPSDHLPLVMNVSIGHAR